MKFGNLIILICIYLTSCSGQQKKQESKIPIDSIKKDQPAKETPPPVLVNWVELRDTIINGINLKFTPLTKDRYDSLSIFTIETKIPLQSFDHLVSKINNCQLIKLKNGATDSLRNKKELSGYFESYEIKGFWKEKNQLLVNFQNWEDWGDFFLSLSNQFHYYLDPEYKLSPNKSLIISYTDITKYPIYSSGLMLSDISKDPIERLFYIELGSLTITQADWINNEKCLIAGGVAESMKLKNNLHYLLTFKKEE